MILQEDGPGLRSGFGRTDTADVCLDGVLGNSQTQLEQFAANAFGSPQPILLRHLLDQRDGLRGELGTTTAIARFELPKETKALAMPAEEGVGLIDECFFPVFHATDEEDEPKAIGLRKGRLFDLAIEDHELLAEEGVLGDQLGFTSEKVSHCGDRYRIVSGLRAMEESVFEI